MVLIFRDLKISNLLLNSRGILKIGISVLEVTNNSRLWHGKGNHIKANDSSSRYRLVLPLPSIPSFNPRYRAPELLFGAREYTKAIDIWSLGLVLGELLLHVPVVPGENEPEQIQLIIALLGTPPSEHAWPEFRNMPLRDEFRIPAASEMLENGKMSLKMRFREYSEATRGLLRKCLEWDPQRRCSARGALQHAYFKEEPRGLAICCVRLTTAQDPALLPTFPEGRNMSENQYNPYGLC